MHPAVQCILQNNGKGGDEIALAIFSNGGAATASHLAAAYRSTAGQPLPCAGMVIDSAVGTVDVNRATAFIVKSLPRPFNIFPLPLLAFAMLWAVFMTMRLCSYVGVEDPITPSRIALNNRALFRTGDKRCYIYSKEDKLVQYGDVETHGEDGKRRGWKVSLEMFRGSQHVAHAMKDNERYWALVRSTLCH